MTAQRDSRGRFRPGFTANPNGRPRGNENRSHIARAVGGRLDTIIERLVELALEGDVAAAKTLLDRIAPPLRARDEAVSVPVSGDPANDAREVVRALGRSEITPVEAATAMRAISEAAKVSELADLENRIAALEQKQ